MCIAFIWVHLERHNDQRGWKNNYTNEGASVQLFGSELHLVHRFEHCTKYKKKCCHTEMKCNSDVSSRMITPDEKVLQTNNTCPISVTATSQPGS